MYRKFKLIGGLIFLALIGFTIFSTSAAEPPPPPCLTNNLCFEHPVKVTNFHAPSDLAVGNINGGNKLDFVTTTWGVNKIRIKTGNGDGTFWGTWTWNMGEGTYEVDIADFNGDGHKDLIASNSEEDQVFIRWGHTGWSTFSKWSTGDRPHFVATADLNNDGLDDFATGNTALNHTVTVRLRKANGGFAPPTHYSAGHFLGDVTFNDCDDDGDLDMFYSAVFTHPNDQEAYVYLRRNNGSGEFSSPTIIDLKSPGYGISPNTITFGDLDEDGWDDFVVARNDHKLIRVLGGADCDFHNSVISAVDSNPFGLDMADMNGDGHLDLVVSHVGAPGLITLYLGQGNGNMNGPYKPELSGTGRIGPDVGLGDFNEDGLIDILFMDGSGVWLMLGREENSPPWLSPYFVLNGLQYGTLGNGRIEVDNNQLILSNIGASGDDGLDALLESADSWSAELAMEGHVGAQLALESIANEATASSLKANATEDGMALIPKFNSDSYRVIYYLDHKPQLNLTADNDGQTPAALFNWDEIWCRMELPSGVPSEICRIAFEHGIDPESLYNWEIDLGVVLLMTAVDGSRVEADRVRIEEIPDSTHDGELLPLSRMKVRGTAVASIVLDEIKIVPSSAFDHSIFLPAIVNED